MIKEIDNFNLYISRWSNIYIEFQEAHVSLTINYICVIFNSFLTHYSTYLVVQTMGAFHSTKNSGNSRLGSEWNRHFPEFHSEILGLLRKVGLKFRKIGITGKFRSIRPFLLGPSFSEPTNRNSTWLILKLLNIILVLYRTND